MAVQDVRARRVVAACLALVTVVAAAACSPSDSGVEDSPSGPLVIARTGGVQVLDPARAKSPEALHTLGLVYDTLLDTDDEGRLTPGLAEDWQVSGDGTTVTFTLREGVDFHGGAAFTAADAEATLQRLLAERTGSAVGASLRAIENMKTPDKHTLVLQLQRPNAALLTALTRVGASMLDSGDIEAGSVARHPNGTGPFRWISWQRGRAVTLGANANYWDGAPKMSRVRFRATSDESRILSGTSSGDFHIGVVTDPGTVRGADAETMQVMEQPTLSYHALVLNTRRGPLRQVRVRQAIACAVDRERIIERVYLGHGAVTGPITSPAYGYNAVAGLPCTPPDRGKARALLAEAGHPNGFRLDAIVPSGGSATAMQMARSLRAQLRRVGIRMEITRQEPDVYTKNKRAAEFDAALARGNGSHDPYLMYSRYFSDDAARAESGGMSTARLDALLREANATTNTERRHEIFRRMQRELLLQSPWVWLLRDPVYYLVGDDVRGFETTPAQSLEHVRSVYLLDSEDDS